MTSEREPKFDPREQEESYLSFQLPNVHPTEVIERIDEHVMRVTIAMKKKNEPLVFSSPLITRRFARLTECRSFTGMAIVMTYVGKILRENKTVTPHDVFMYFHNKYDKPFFHDQDDCDKPVRETSMLLCVSRRSMGILA